MYHRARKGKEKALGPKHTSTLDIINALQPVSEGDYEKVVQTLLDNGADFNADINAEARGTYSNALQIASARGYKKAIQILLDNKADINA